MMVGAGSRPRREPALTKYEVLEELGHGGMATVYRAHDSRLGRDVAIKVLHPHLKENQEIAHRFAVEARAVAKLRHPNIVEVFDISGDDEQEQYLVVELVRGQTLRAVLQRHGAFPPEVAAALAAELLGAVAHAHTEGVVHRDIKPENVLIEHRPEAPSSRSDAVDAQARGDLPNRASSSETELDGKPREDRGARFRVKLTDFGIAKLLDAQGVTSTGQVLGSPAHMAPEQIEGGDVDGRADVFGMGVLLYECMVGHLPFEGKNPAQVLRRVLDGVYASAERERPIIGQAFSRILDRALAREPSDRFADAQAFREALLGELARVGISAPRAELERFFDDPDGYGGAHDDARVSRLCSLAKAAAKRGDVLGAAADYNRALAYHPTDPELMRIVGTMHRSEARRRTVRRTVPLALFTLTVGSGAFLIARSFKASGEHRLEPAEPSPSTTAAPPNPQTTTSTAASSVPAPRPTSERRRPVVPLGPLRPTPLSSTADAGTLRTVGVSSVQPKNGVFVSLDGAQPTAVSESATFRVDRRSHRLVFTCANDLCEPSVQDVSQGEGDVVLPDLSLRIHPARVLVEGDATHTYGIVELPNIVLSPGIEVQVPMVHGDRIVTVFDRVDSSVKKQEHRLVANQKKVIDFTSP